jgi:hypothetical protein
MKDVLKELFPPEVPQIVKWRLAIFAVVLLFLFHVAWACGWLKWSGIGSGFASAADLVKVETTVKDIKITLIDQSIFDAKDSECTATDPRARKFFASRVQTLSREYHTLTGFIFNIPPCKDSP